MKLQASLASEAVKGELDQQVILVKSLKGVEPHQGQSQ